MGFFTYFKTSTGNTFNLMLEIRNYIVIERTKSLLSLIWQILN